MGKKLNAPGWFKESFARYRAQRAKGDLPVSEMYELLADDIQGRHEAGDVFGRALWIKFVTGYDEDVRKTQASAADEERALAEATGLLQSELFPREVLDELGLAPEVDLGWGKKVATPDLDWAGFEKAISEVERREKSWEKSLGEEKAALKRGQALVPADNSKTLRQVIADPEEYGHGTGAQ